MTLIHSNSSPHTRPAIARIHEFIAFIVLIAQVAICSGCSSRPAGALSISANDEATSFAPVFTTAAYLPIDSNTAEVYLTDLPIERLNNPKDTLADAQGSIIHIHLFLIPSAGDTPIDNTACNITVRHLLLAGAGTGTTPVLGLYGGGGFIDPWGSIGDDRISGTIDRSSHRLIRSTAGFKDLLGPGSASGSFASTRDDALVARLAGRFDALTRLLPPPQSIEQENAEKISKTLKAKVGAGKGGEGESGSKAEKSAKPAKGTK